MSRLEELIQQYCPDGVEYKPLGEVCDFRNGFAFKSNLFTDEGCPIIRITNISENNVDMSDLKYFHMEDYPKSDLSQFAIKKGDILVAMSGATTGKIGTYKGNITAYLNQRTGKFEPKESLNNRFLYHFLQTQVSNMYKMAGGGAQPNLSSNDLKSKIVIPVPPLPVQEEIVRILDNFAELQAELQVELQAELQKRLQQYNYYRDNLLSFEGRTDVEWKKLGEVVRSLTTGLNPRQTFKLNVDGATYPYITGKDIFNNSINPSSKTDKISFDVIERINKRAKLEDDMLLFASTGTGTVGRMAYIQKYSNDWSISETLYAIKTKSFLNTRYFMYYLTTEMAIGQYRGKISKGSVPHLKIADLMNVVIPIPSMEEQHRVVELLCHFDTLVNDITAGLPAEIEARRKQYEHYRDTLLTLKKK